jgi:protease-4
MGSVAASGGYWISTASDEIWASPQTITGSIGIYGVLASVEKPLAKYLGVHVDGVGTTWLSGALRPDRHMDPAALDMVRMYVERGYEDFLEHVGAARNMKRDEVDKLARGRIWTGARAKELGLVDRLGDLDAAIAAAAERAKLGPAYRLRYVEQPRSLRDRVLDRLSAWAGDDQEAAAEPWRASPAEQVLTQLWDAADRLSVWSDPRGVYAHCLCGEEWP